MRLGIVTPVLAISTLLTISCKSNESVEVMPVTTDSELALEYFETGMVAFDQLKLSLAWQNLELAIQEDPDFFMAYYWMYMMSGEYSKKLAEKAFQTKASLNEAESQIKTAFKYLLDGQNEKVVEHLQKAIDLYPSDPNVHKILYILQIQFLKDYQAAVKSLNLAIETQPDFALAYNYLGYALMDLKEFDRAEEAFNQYIRLAPSLANPYDSKGDFYMTTEQFDKAYDSYIKAFEIDSGFVVSEKKAMKAKHLLEKLNVQ